MLRMTAWLVGTGIVAAITIWETADQLRRGSVGVDLLAILTMIGALVLGQYLVGIVIALMVATGRALEEYAGRKARKTLTAMLERAPRTAQRYHGEAIETVPVNDVAADDRLLIRRGEAVPVDCLLSAAVASLDESTLTGEPLPVTHRRGDRLSSGIVNVGPAFEVKAIATAANSTYAAIVRLVEQAQNAKAPFTRVADRYAALFIPLALLIAGAAWLISDSSLRALSVLVVATPCPLILAAPIAIVAGISRAARRNILIKSGTALEKIAKTRTILFDKTGTLTRGSSAVFSIECAPHVEPEPLLRLSASLSQASTHVSAQALVAEAQSKGLSLALPEDVRELPGSGVQGMVDGHRVAIGNYHWLEGQSTSQEWGVSVLRKSSVYGLSPVFVSVDGELIGCFLLEDAIRLESPRALRRLRLLGIDRLIMVSGDRLDAAETIASALGIDSVLAERSPDEKVSAVKGELGKNVVMMVGDGINDAPALAAADVGVAMGARGATASAEAADAIILVDRLDRIADLVTIARRAYRIARQSVILGMGLSMCAMGAAAFGYMHPIWGALLQEVIDLAVIANALRALAPQVTRGTHSYLDPDLLHRLEEEHKVIRPLFDRIESTARALELHPEKSIRQELNVIAESLRANLLPHETEDEQRLYPQLSKLLAGDDPMSAMSRSHREIFHLARLYIRIVQDLPAENIPEFELNELRRLLFSLSAILRLHFTQEEEIFQSVIDAE